MFNDRYKKSSLSKEYNKETGKYELKAVISIKKGEEVSQHDINVIGDNIVLPWGPTHYFLYIRVYQ